MGSRNSGLGHKVRDMGPPQPGDEATTWTAEELEEMNARFAKAMRHEARHAPPGNSPPSPQENSR
jgi:hypothetical protein